MQLTAAEFSKFQRVIYDCFGIVLAETKRDMLANRLRMMLTERGFNSFDDYYEQCLKNPSVRTLDELINRVSTNHTYFYRESRHFVHLCKEALPNVVPKAKRRGNGKPEFRLWCAAASTGQEPYGLAMQLREYWGKEYAQWSAGLLATDISERALLQAQEGKYAGEDVNPIPPDLRSKYLRKLGRQWEVCPELRQDVLFRRLNLMTKVLPFKKPFDVIFCRNVMIYFDNDTRRDLVQRFYDALYPGGYLYVGLAESLGKNAGQLRMVEPGVYRKGG